MFPLSGWGYLWTRGARPHLGQNAPGRRGFLWVGVLDEMKYPSQLRCKSVSPNVVGRLITLGKLGQDIGAHRMGAHFPAERHLTVLVFLD